MSCDSKLYINNKYSNKKIRDLIHNTYVELLKKDAPLPEIKVCENTGDHFFMYYRLDSGYKVGMLTIGRDVFCGFDCIYIIGIKNKYVKNLLSSISKKIGGILILDDASDDVAELIQPDEINESMLYTFERICMGLPESDEEVDELIEFIKKSKKD